MAYLLDECTIEEKLVVIRFLFSEGTTSLETYLRMLKQYGKSFMNPATFYLWMMDTDLEEQT